MEDEIKDKEKEVENELPDSQIGNLTEQVEDITNKWKRAVADYQNLEKRITRDRQDWQKFSNTVLLSKLISLSDNLERAASHGDGEGLKLIIKDLQNIFLSEGVK